jgi:hypothetical protein
LLGVDADDHDWLLVLVVASRIVVVIKVFTKHVVRMLGDLFNHPLGHLPIRVPLALKSDVRHDAHASLRLTFLNALDLVVFSVSFVLGTVADGVACFFVQLETFLMFNNSIPNPPRGSTCPSG